MAKRYEQYCPMAHALDLVGDRWALLVVRELMHGPKRYTDLVDGLPGIGTNILASASARPRGERRRHATHAATTGRVAGLRAHRLRPRAAAGHARAGTLGCPLPRPADARGRPVRRAGSPTRSTSPSRRSHPPVTSSSGSATRSHRWSTARSSAGPVDDPDVVVEADATALYSMFVDRRLDAVKVTGDRDLLERLVAAAPPRLDEPVGS